MDLPGLDHQLGDDIDALRDAVRAFAAAEIAPRAAEIDRSDQFPMDLWKKMGDLGCSASPSPRNTAAPAWVPRAHGAMEESAAPARRSAFVRRAQQPLRQPDQAQRQRGAEAEVLPSDLRRARRALAMSEAGAGSDVISMKLKAESATAATC